MLERLSQFLILTLSFVLAVVLLFLIFLWGNPAAFWHTAGELHDGFAGFLAALGMGIKILFFVALGLGGAAAVVKVNQSRKVQVISANKYGTPPAMVIHERGVARVEHLSTGQMDTTQLMAALKQSM